LFNSALKDASLQKNTALAFKAFNPDISPQPHYLPLIAAAGVLLLQANHITQFYLHSHAFVPASAREELKKGEAFLLIFFLFPFEEGG